MSSLRVSLIIVPLAFLLALTQPARSDPTIVYNNTSTGTRGNYVPEGLPQGFWRFNQFKPNELMGDQITLAGTDRYVTEFDLALSSSEPTTVGSMVFSLYGFDSNIFSAGDRIWTTTLANVSIDGNTIVSIPMPGVLVPDTFIWVVGADSNTAGWATFNMPTVGSSSPYYFWDLDPPTLQWYATAFDGDPAANFGARVLAVPEPTLTVLLPLAGFLMLRRKRSRLSLPPTGSC
jgi:hypothetical protein